MSPPVWLQVLALAVDAAVVVWLMLRAPRLGVRDRSIVLFLAALGAADVVRLVTSSGSTSRIVAITTVLVVGLGALLQAYRRLIPEPDRPTAVRVVPVLTAVTVGTFLLTVGAEGALPLRGPAVRFGFALLAGWLTLLGVMAWALIRDGRRRGQHWRSVRERTLGVALVVLALSFGLRVAGWAARSPAPYLVGAVFGILAVVTVALAYSPPRWLLAAWSRADVSELAVAERDLIRYATGRSELLQRAVSAAVELYDAEAAALVEGDGRVLVTHGDSEHLDRVLEAPGELVDSATVRVVTVPRQERDATLVLVPSRSGPLLGDRWPSLLDTYRVALGVALDRVEVTSHERDQRDRGARLLDGLAGHRVGVVRVEGFVVADVSEAFALPGWEAWWPLASTGVDVRTLVERTDRLGDIAASFASVARGSAEHVRWSPDGHDTGGAPSDVSVFDCSVSVQGAGDGFLLVQDVSNLHAVEAEAVEKHRRLAQAEEVAAMGSWEWDVVRDEVTWSDELCRLFGEDPAVFRPSLEDYRSRVDPRDRAAADGAVFRALQQGTPWELVYRIRRADGSVRWFETRGRIGATSAQGTVLRLQGTCRDVTEERARVDELLRHRRQLQELSRRLVHAQEEERRQIALRLHDELGQVVTGLDLQLATLRGVAPPEDLDALRAGLQELHVRLRDLAHDLRPPALDDLGLADAVSWLGRRAEDRLGIDVTIDVRDVELEGLSMDRQVAAYRIVQESLTNAARHAPGATVRVTVFQGDDVLVLEVSDDGPGFDPRSVGEDATGLKGMRERATAVGGELQVLARRDVGTLVRARLPHPPSTPAPPSAGPVGSASG